MDNNTGEKNIKVALAPFGAEKTSGLSTEFLKGFLLDLESLLRVITTIGTAPVSLLFGKLNADGTKGKDLPRIALGEEAPQNLRELIFKELSPDALITGAFTGDGDTMRLRVSVFHEPQTKALEKEYSGPRDEFGKTRFALLRDLCEYFKPIINKSAWDVRENRNVDIFHAYELYCEALSGGEMTTARRLELLQKAREASPNFFDAAILVGETLSAHGKTEELEKYVQTLLREFPGHPPANTFAAFYFLRKGDSATADKLMTEAIGAAPDDPNLYAFQGYLKIFERRYDEAEKALRHALSFEFRDPLWHHFLGLALSGQQKYREAVTEWEETLRRNPYFSTALQDMATAYEQLGEFDRATDCYQKLLRTDSENYMVRYRFGVLLLHLQKPEQAREHLESCVELNPQFAWGFYDLGIVRQALGETEESRKAFSKAVELDQKGEAGRRAAEALMGLSLPETPEISAQMREAAEALGAQKWTDAASILEAILRKNGKHWKAWYLLGLVYYRQNKAESAAPAMKQALSLNPELYDGYVICVGSYLKMNQPQDARLCLKDALEKYPERAEIICARGMLKIHDGEFAEAEDLFARAKKIAPDKPLIQECFHYLEDAKQQKKWWQFWKKQ